jgi:hypothetical protein
MCVITAMSLLLYMLTIWSKIFTFMFGFFVTGADSIVLCTKISIIKLPLTIERILVAYGYREGVEPQGLLKNCYQVFQD